VHWPIILKYHDTIGCPNIQPVASSRKYSQPNSLYEIRIGAS
jgi:hypothetical protein